MRVCVVGGVERGAEDGTMVLVELGKLRFDAV